MRSGAVERMERGGMNSGGLLNVSVPNYVRQSGDERSSYRTARLQLTLSCSVAVLCAISGMNHLKVWYWLGSAVSIVPERHGTHAQCPLFATGMVDPAARRAFTDKLYPSSSPGSVRCISTPHLGNLPSDISVRDEIPRVLEPPLQRRLQHGSLRRSDARSPDGFVRLLRPETKVPVRLFFFTERAWLIDIRARYQAVQLLWQGLWFESQGCWKHTAAWPRHV